ncbi:mitochondrial carrier [Coniophora puteana RWD-64-598 SS2]|uniref:Mitochondrial carrier n=1 Tax=Coniophora puteana (strain RWD-64-598) TaxID=741705 RepID=A0A5M3N5F3_CONPW|nr:mitochondrial carrier [Coniophora puteana RWD-64-598 SS2]EIW86536.1 mitochondrial carrier [Coniophora puteana RWD-64-598 SS2]
MQYTSTALAMPLEVGKLLLQIQWLPRETGETEMSQVVQEKEPEEEQFSESSDDESYFADPSGNTVPRNRTPRIVDDNGYVVRTSILDEGTRPEYIIPPGTADTTWAMVKRIVAFQGEGWTSLWKGLLTSCIHDVLSSNLQPVLDNFLQSLFLSATPDFSGPPLLLPVLSHVVTGFLLSPLDLVRTRLIAQSAMQRHKTYTGPIHALSHIITHEGGLKGIYLHPHLFIPTLLDNTLRPLLHIVLPVYIARNMGIGPHVAADTYPVVWGIAELLGNCASLLVTLPIETVRRRLQVQTRGTAKPLQTCVETRPVPYNGVVDAMWHIISEERSDLPLKTDRKKRTEEEAENDNWRRHTGIGQLYRGLGMRLSASVIVFLLSTVNGDETDAGWAEL